MNKFIKITQICLNIAAIILNFYIIILILKRKRHHNE